MTYTQAISAISKGRFVPAIAFLLDHLAYDPEDGGGWLHLSLHFLLKDQPV